MLECLWLKAVLVISLRKNPGSFSSECVCVCVCVCVYVYVCVRLKGLLFLCPPLGSLWSTPSHPRPLRTAPAQLGPLPSGPFLGGLDL